MKNVFAKISLIFLISLSLSINPASAAAEKNFILKPFTLAKIYKNSKHLQVAEKVKQQLVSAGYQIVGTYEPYETSKIFVITNNALLNTAAKTKFGGFGAGLRVSITQMKSDVQVTHNNPSYIGVAYQMKTFLTSTRQKLAQTLGYVKDFGGKGVPSNELADYNYSMGLEGFNGFMNLAEHKSHQEALKQMEAGFSKNLKNIQKVYRIDIPGKKTSIFGLSLKSDLNDQKFLNDKYVMDIIDNKELRRSSHLPYEIMVIDKKIIVMHPHFRIALNFPDLRMFGKNSFGKLMDLPYVYEEFFIQLAGGVWPIPEETD
ncbi:MAG: hypothetical protein OEY65_05205 [Gammaproteobacteria bacterium]|nr:hypothetical protein [Gammaproteobacteria bacterium]